MRVSFYVADQHPWRDRSIGITGYTDGLIRGLQQREGIEIEAITSASSYRPPEPALEHRLPLRTDRRLGRLLVDQLACLVPVRADIWHFPKGFLPVALRSRRPTVGTVHDTIVMHYARRYPRARSRAEFAYFRAVLRRSLARLDLVLTVSETSRAQILALCEAERIAPPPIHVTYEGARWEDKAGTRSTKHDYVVHLGSGAPHKRAATLLSHWKTLQDAGERLPPLCIVGSLDPATRALAKQLRDVELRGREDDAALEATLSAARALILPSEIEGFGLPALEAYYLGTPAVYVTGTSVEEVVGRGMAGGFSLDDPDSLLAALREVLALDAEAIAKHGLSLRERFAWRRCVDRTIRAYESVF